MDGNTVYVYNGTYYENVVVNKDGINLVGEDKNTTIIDAGGEDGWNWCGIDIQENSDYNFVSGFTIINAYYVGIFINSQTAHSSATCNYNTISDCIVRDCGGYGSSYGIRILAARWSCHADYNIIENCEVFNITGGTNIGIRIGAGDSTANACYNQIINSKSHNNTKGIEISGNGAYVNSNIVSNCDLFNNTYGIFISSSINNTISDNNISNNFRGVWLQSSNNNTIMDNNIIQNDDDVVWLNASHYNIISANTIGLNGDDGIDFDSSNNNIIIGNNISSNNRHGIYFLNSNNNTIKNNNINSNNLSGIYMPSLHGPSNDNIIYHNNFIDNIQNSSFDKGSNIWHNSTFQEGNYWSDYSGVDANYDGIGDTPYDILGGSNQDLYPLMELYDPNLVARWHFDEGTGAISHDSSGNGNDGTINGATWTDGVSGTALSFDGDYDYVDFGDVNEVEGLSQMTVSAWIKPQSIDSTKQFIITKEDAWYFQVGDWLNNDEMVFIISGTPDSTENCVQYQINLNEWYHVAVAYDNPEIYLYVDGILRDSDTNIPMPTSGHPLSIGARKNSGAIWGDFFNGTIDEVSIYNRAFTDSEILTLYQQYIPPKMVYVDDDYTPSTPGWQYDHFDVIQDGIDAVAEGGTVYVYNGTYSENIIINKTINLTGEDKNITIIDGGGGNNYDAVYIEANWVNVSRLTIKNSGSFSDGIDIISKYNSIFNNIISNNAQNGIYLHDYNCRENNIFNNRIYSNSLNGIEILGRPGNNISGNHIGPNNANGIRLSGDCSNNIIYNNYLGPNNLDGIEIHSAHDNIILKNIIFDNRNKGVSSFAGGQKNYIYHNNLINNSAYDIGSNLWNHSYPYGGNYWSSYSGTDNYHGPNQDILGGDGIGDTSLNIQGGGIDNYPLIFPYKSITKINVLPVTQIVGPGDTFNISVFCEQIQPIKSFELDIDFNATFIQADSVSEGDIFNGYSTFFNDGTVNNTTGYIDNIYNLITGEGNVTKSGILANISLTSKNEYGISNISLSDIGITNDSAYVPIVYYNGSILVAPNWDINLDYEVSILDLVLVANHFDETGSPGWIREDVNNDGEISILDLVFIANHFDDTW